MECLEYKTVSVIIPVYNTEKGLEQCLNSVLEQTYQNLEVILIDDGSTDGSGEICDRYADQDRRVRVVHQKNAGVAAARNIGLDMATGAYIGWVDSDDWIEPQMFEHMLNGALAYRADIVICGRHEVYPGHSFVKSWKQQEILNRSQAVSLLVEDDLVKSYLWDKLWRRELFENICIPDLRVFEDMAVMYPLFIKAERVLCLPEVLYHYKHERGSLSENPSLESRFDFYTVTKARYESLQQDFPQLAERIEAVLVSAAIHIWTVFGKCTRQERAEYKEKIMEIADFCKKHYKKARMKQRMGMAGQLVLRLTPYPTWWAFALAGLVGWLYEQRHHGAL